MYIYVYVIVFIHILQHKTEALKLQFLTDHAILRNKSLEYYFLTIKIKTLYIDIIRLETGGKITNKNIFS